MPRQPLAFQQIIALDAVMTILFHNKRDVAKIEDFDVVGVFGWGGFNLLVGFLSHAEVIQNSRVSF